MALLTQQRRPLSQQGRVVAAMGPVAQRAVLRRGGVFPKIRALFLAMAGVTGFVDGRLLEQELIITIVRIMAVAAGHVAESQRVAAGLQGIGPALGVAFETGFLLRK